MPVRFRNSVPAAAFLAVWAFLLGDSPLRGQSVGDSRVGYIDNAIPGTQVRLRYDAGFNMNRPDRAEFFFAEWKELGFHPHGIQGDGVFFDPRARGSVALPSRLDSQEVTTYLEYAFSKRFSAFVDVPVRFNRFGRDLEEIVEGLGGDPNPFSRSGFFNEPVVDRSAEARETEPFSTSGLSDLQVGFKAALLLDPNQCLTFQFRTYIPTGNTSRGLGTGHVSLEPGLLLYRRLTDRLLMESQFRAWVPIDGGKAAGNILIYGLGLGYDVYQRGNLRFTPVTEFVGWTVLNGFESVFGPISATSPPGLALPRTHGVENAAGDTIVNGKFGVRTSFGNGHSVYVGYGRSLTGDRWFRDVLRVEYRFVF